MKIEAKLTNTIHKHFKVKINIYIHLTKLSVESRSYKIYETKKICNKK